MDIESAIIRAPTSDLGIPSSVREVMLLWTFREAQISCLHLILKDLDKGNTYNSSWRIPLLNVREIAEGQSRDAKS
jgi:hypothetical protein